MKYYKHSKTGEVFAYETKVDRDKWGAPELVKMTAEEIDAHLNPVPSLDTLAASKRGDIETARHTAEAEGITHNAIRYAGDPGNRQAIREALEAATDTGLETFSSWKDSNNQFHSDHPVPDVWAALSAIATRRSQLIEREGQLVGQIDAILADEQLSDDEKREALEAIEWSET